MSDRDASPPAIAVVIAATDSVEAVERTLASLGSCRVVVAYDPSRVDGSRLSCEAIAGPPGANAHRLRRIGLRLVSEPIVAFTEDSCILAPGWLEAWRIAFADPLLMAATGPVEHLGGGTALDEAVFLCEYAPFLMSRVQTNRLAGNNFAVRASELDRSSPDIHESEVARSAGRVGFVAGASVLHARRYRLGPAIHDRLRFGFRYGRLRAASSSDLRRAFSVALGPGILASQIARLAWTLARKRRGGLSLALGGVFTPALLAAWSVGEWLGWVAGDGRPDARKPGGTAVRTHERRPARVSSARPRYRGSRSSA